jgi:hypothetical protein
MVEKICTKCGIKKPITSFYKATRDGKDGFRSDCKECYRIDYVLTESRRAYQREYKKTEKSRALARAWRAKPENIEKARIYNQKRNSTPEVKARMRERINTPEVKERRKGYTRKTKYGITPEEYSTMHASQNGNCAICEKNFETLCVDHDHDTGRVRGLLCQSCNKFIGLAFEDISILNASIDYLKSFEKESVG